MLLLVLLFLYLVYCVLLLHYVLVYRQKELGTGCLGSSLCGLRS